VAEWDNLPADVVALLRLRKAAGLIQTGELETATELLKQIEGEAVSAPPKDLAEQWLRLADAWTKRSTLDAEAAAELAYRQAALRVPAAGLGALSQFLQRQKRLPEAIDCWRELARLDPAASSTALKLAHAYEIAGQAADALATYLALVAAAPTHMNYLLVAERLDRLAAQLPDTAPNRSVRIALLGNATLAHLQSYVKVDAFRMGLRPEVYQCSFDQYAQDILDPNSELYRFAPDVVVLAIHPSKLFPTLHNYPFDETVEARHAEIHAGLQVLEGLLNRLSNGLSALVLVHNFVAPQWPALGVLDQTDEFGQAQAFAEINAGLVQLVRSQYKNVYIVDEDRIQARVGKANATDPRMWLSARSPWSAAALAGLATEYTRFLRAVKGLNRKCIVLDLDNTLWGGVVGEDGVSGLHLGAEAPGNAFVAFQRELERLWRRGILLAVCSKNNLEDALTAIDEHPEMVLRSSYFAAHRINWASKTDNLREIARELNIGLDSLVFMDDNPAERALIRATLPEVLVPELPSDPSYFRSVLLELGVFDTLAMTDEDRRRNELYQQQKARRQIESTVPVGEAGIEHYLSSLEIVVEIDEVNAQSLSRVAQLTGKANQFNLTTRRYTEAEIAARLASGWRAYCARVRDRFGDSGLTGVVIVTPHDAETWEVDTLLLSCRVMGRGVETAFLTFVADLAQQAGVKTLEGWYLPTSKNEPARDCYARSGFQCVRETREGSLWALTLAQPLLQAPLWLKVLAPALR
jgi:FkbH-like protein